jgi:hypothetical protein
MKRELLAAKGGTPVGKRCSCGDHFFVFRNGRDVIGSGVFVLVAAGKDTGMCITVKYLIPSLGLQLYTHAVCT